MNIFLDDERPVPEGWIGVKTANEAIEALQQYDVAEISLDHDLGEGNVGNGYDVLLWIEEQVVMNNYVPPKIAIHTANPSAREKMKAARETIIRLVEKMNNQ